MTKKDLIDAVAELTGSTKVEAKANVEAVLNAISNELKDGNTVDLTGFGKFSVKEHAARMGINPVTKEPMEIAAGKSVGFKAAKALKELVK